MAVKHEESDRYLLQIMISGNWHDTKEYVTKKSGAKRARSQAKKTGSTYRVINLTKNRAEYISCEPR